MPCPECKEKDVQIALLQEAVAELSAEQFDQEEIEIDPSDDYTLDGDPKELNFEDGND